MLTKDQMPEDNHDLAKIEVQFPNVPPEDARDPDNFVANVMEYLQIEDYTPDDGKLHFVRNARVEETDYYIWRFVSVEEECFATVSIDTKGNICTGCYENIWGFTPEQFILADYHRCM